MAEAPDRSPETVTLRSLGLTVYLPTIIYFLGQGAILPVVALSAIELGASFATASIIVALIGIGQMAAAVPAGALIARFGERPAMLLATGVLAPAVLACILAPSVWVLGVGVTCVGVAGATWGVARQTYVTEVIPYELRARALSTLGGTSRIGGFLGPFVGAGAVKLLGTDGAYWVNLVTAVLAAATLLALPDLPSDRARRGASGESTLGIIRGNLRVLRTLGLGMLLVSALRASRNVLVPLWGAHLGLDATTLSVIFGFSAGIDMLLFYPAGKIMDRWGRRWVAIPSTSLLGLSLALLPLTSTAGTLAAVGILMGLGNGLSSGLIMTLGADVAPPSGRAQFLGAWRLCSDVGNGGGPLLISAVISTASLAAAVFTMAGVGLLAAAVLYRLVPRPAGHRDPDPATATRT